MTEERMKMIRNRGVEITREVCLKAGIEKYKDLVGIASQLIFCMRIDAFESAIEYLDITMPSEEDQHKCSIAAFTILQRCLSDLEINSLQDSSDDL